MRFKKLSLGLTAALAMFAAAQFLPATPASAQTEKVLYSSEAPSRTEQNPQVV